MRVYQGWGLCSYEEHKLLVLADKLYRKQHPQKEPSDYTIKPPTLKLRDDPS